MAIIMNAPWAKFTTSMTPNIRLSPTATSAKVPPTNNPDTNDWLKRNTIYLCSKSGAGSTASPLLTALGQTGTALTRPSTSKNWPVTREAFMF